MNFLIDSRKDNAIKIGRIVLNFLHELDRKWRTKTMWTHDYYPRFLIYILLFWVMLFRLKNALKWRKWPNHTSMSMFLINNGIIKKSEMNDWDRIDSMNVNLKSKLKKTRSTMVSRWEHRSKIHSIIHVHNQILS